MKWIVPLIIGMLLASCGASVTVDYDKAINFSNYTTYNYYEQIESGLNNLDNNRIMNTLDSLLSEKGYVKSEKPQLLVNFFSNETISSSGNTIGIGFGGGKHVGIGISGDIPIGSNVINQLLTLDIIDFTRDALVWQAVIASEYKEKATPEEKEDHYQKIIQKALKLFPPK